MATNNYGAKPKGPAKSTTAGARGGGFTPPSAGQHPPGKTVGGQHSPGKPANHGGGYGKGLNVPHPSIAAPKKRKS
jgi:hypothetical protein